MYGSLTALIMVMLWLYICMNLLLYGAEINAYFEKQFRMAQASNEGNAQPTSAMRRKKSLIKRRKNIWKKIRGYSEIQTDAEGMNIKDKIITLSTCTGNEATRYVVQGKRVDTLDVGQ